MEKHVFGVRSLRARHLTIMAVLLALLIVFSFVPAVNFGNLLQIGVGFIGTAFTGALLGPVYGAIIAVANDLITYFMNGTGFFFPGFTLTAGLAAFIYGRVLWRQTISWKRVLLAVVLVSFICNIGLNSLWVKIMYDRAWMAFFPMRVLKNLVSIPVNTLILTALFKLPTVQRLIKEFQF